MPPKAAPMAEDAPIEAAEPVEPVAPEPEAVAAVEPEPVAEIVEAAVGPDPVDASYAAQAAIQRAAVTDALDTHVSDLVAFLRGKVEHFEDGLDGVLALIGERLRAAL